MASAYRIRYVSDGGPVREGNARGWPVASRPFKTLLSAMKALRDVLNADSRVGTELGVSLQFRFGPGETWHWISAKDTDRYAQALRLTGWTRLSGTGAEST